MELVSLTGKTNFFEKRVGEYAKANVAGNSASGKAFDMDAGRKGCVFPFFSGLRRWRRRVAAFSIRPCLARGRLRKCARLTQR